MISKYNTALLVLIFITLTGIHTSKARRHRTTHCKPRVGIITIEIRGCKKLMIGSTGCDGHCSSSAIPKVTGFATTCSCCAPVERVTKPITLNCANGVKRKLSLPVAKKCKCRPC